MAPVRTSSLQASSGCEAGLSTMQQRHAMENYLRFHEPKMRKMMFILVRHWAGLSGISMGAALAILRIHLGCKGVPRIGDLYMIDLPIAFGIIHDELQKVFSETHSV